MADVLCLNCHKSNSSDLTYCRFCGTRLPRELLPGKLPVDPSVSALETAHQQLQESHVQLTASHQQLQEQHQQVLDQTQQLQSAYQQLQGQHQQLLEQHQQVAGELTEAQQRQKVVDEQKQQAEGQIDGLLAQIAEMKQHLEEPTAGAPEVEGFITELQQKLKKAEEDLQVAAGKIKRFEASPVGQITQPLWIKLVSWGLLPLLGSAGGLAIGAYSGFNPYKTQLNKTLSGESDDHRQLQSIQSQLTATKQQLNQTQQQLATEQQNGTQVNSQLGDLQKNAQASAAQLAAVKSELASAKTEIAKDRELINEKDQQLQAARTENQQLTPRAALTAALQEIINHHPYLNYKGPVQGTVTVRYSARNDKPLHITIDHFQATSDSDVTVESLSGTSFPAVPLIIEPMTKNTTISSPPSPANGWQRVIITVQGKGSSQAVLKWTVF